MPQIITLNDRLNFIDDIYKKQIGITITSDLDLLDKRRDLAVIGMRSVVESYTYHFDPAKRAAGRVLLQSIDQYKVTIIKQNYHAKTILLRNLTEDWEKIMVLKAALITLDLKDWEQEIRVSNISFNTIYLKQNTEYTKISKTDMASLIDKAHESYISLTNHITTHATLSLSDTYNKVVKDINLLTAKYNLLVEKRLNIAIDTRDINLP
ncbi:DUF6261 family protein [Aquimarina sp. AU474]|uniref:DUF6261 family protein n=1 Tax=Aquimarina sp. AU474 TaxID=2108529 RepID=UPI0013596B16|nr:DUF6261 family protein [Aquimarina sp. AU474]